MINVFTLRPDHLGWQDCETGAPEIDPKRPYGNSFVAGDVADILGWDVGDEMSDAMREMALAIHRETEFALQIVLRRAGDYSGRWVKERL